MVVVIAAGSKAASCQEAIGVRSNQSRPWPKRLLAPMATLRCSKLVYLVAGPSEAAAACQGAGRSAEEGGWGRGGDWGKTTR